MEYCYKHKIKLQKETFTDGSIEETEYICYKCIERLDN